jgi:hypothetical protein
MRAAPVIDAAVAYWPSYGLSTFPHHDAVVVVRVFLTSGCGMLTPHFVAIVLELSGGRRMHVRQLLERRVAAHPDQLFLLFDQVETSYGAFDATVNQVANGFRQMGFTFLSIARKTSSGGTARIFLIFLRLRLIPRRPAQNADATGGDV